MRRHGPNSGPDKSGRGGTFVSLPDAFNFIKFNNMGNDVFCMTQMPLRVPIDLLQKEKKIDIYRIYGT